MHAAISRVSGCRPSEKDVSRVKADFFNGNLGRIEEHNQIYRCTTLIRNLWQKVPVSMITGDTLTEEAKSKIANAGGSS